MQSAWQEKLCHTHKSYEAGTRSWNNTRKSPQGNKTQSGIMVETIHRHEHGTQNKSLNRFWEGPLQVNEQFSAWKNCRVWKEALRHPNCGNW